MVNSYEACSSAISIFLLILAILEIITTAIPLITVPDLLRFTGTHLAAVCGLIAGLVTLPASIRLKFNESSSDSDKLHGHTSFFKKLTLFVSLILNVIAATVTVIGLLMLRNFAHEFGRAMKVYHCNTQARMLVNLVQIELHCCGAMCYKDWLSLNWRMYEVSNDDDNSEEETNSAVPFSCCNGAVAMACGHYDLRTHGTCSIYKVGCAKHLRSSTKHYFWILFTLYMINIALEVLLLVIYFSNKPDDDACSDWKKQKKKPSVITAYSRIDATPWEGMSNCSKGSDRSFKDSTRTRTPRDSEESECDCSYEDSTELTSSHKQVRIYSPFGKSRRNIRIHPDE